MTAKSEEVVFLPAAALGVEPAFVRGYENEGLLYLTCKDSRVVGAQCIGCHRILWVDQRQEPVFNEKKPAEVQDFGDGYRAYYRDQTSRFMKSLPACPSCGRCEYDKLINNVNYPRFESGIEMVSTESGAEIVPVDASAVLIAYKSARSAE
jgi:hypothetical protein